MMSIINGHVFTSDGQTDINCPQHGNSVSMRHNSYEEGIT